MKKLFTKIAVAVAGFSGVLTAQQDPQFTQFMHSKLIYNPGYAGTSDAICAVIQYRQQWVNFPGAPKTALLSFDMPLGTLPLGIGLNVMNDQIGPIKTTFARLALAYNQQLGAGKLGIGIDGGILQLGTSNDWIAPEPGKADSYIPGYAGNSSVSSNPNLNKLSYDLGAGVFYQIQNKMYVGISSTHLTAQDLKSAGSTDPQYRVARHYYVVAGYQLNINPDNAIIPNVKVKTDAATTQLDLNLTYQFRNTVWVGATYRMQDAVSPMLGVKLLKNKSLKIGYSYDYTLSKVKGYTSGTHEIIIGYCMNKKKPKAQTVGSNVRFLD
ncbi:MAG: PorP/SprF family type IX secretion system membrane protein [Bacteroidia bacterium]